MSNVRSGSPLAGLCWEGVRVMDDDELHGTARQRTTTVTALGYADSSSLQRGSGH